MPPTLVAVYASAEALARGVSAGWWDSESVRLVPAEGWAAVSAVTCQAWCKAEPDGGCGGFMVSHGVCQLRAPVDCHPALGEAELPAPDMLVGATVVAGLAKGCTAQPPPPPTLGAGFECPTRRCTEPAPDVGVFDGDLLVPDNCYYALFHGAAGTPKLLDVFRGKWVVFAGASNLILTASLFANMDGGDFFAWLP